MTAVPETASPAPMTIRDHWAVLRGGAGLILPSVVIAILLAAAVSGIIPRQYQASTTVYVGQSLTEPSFDYGGLLASQLLTPMYARLVTTTELLNAVADELGLDTDATQLAQRVKTDVPPGGTLIIITATADSPEAAAELANTLAGELVLRAPAQQVDQAELERALANLNQEIEATRQALLDLLAQPSLTPAEQATVDQLQRSLSIYEASRDSLSSDLVARSPNSVTVVDPATPPEFASAPSRTLIVVTAAATALVLAVLLAYLMTGVWAFRARRADAT